MKSLFIYSFLFWAGLGIVSAQMAMDPIKQPRSKTETLENQFSMAYLSESQLIGFENRAKQKVREFYDYLNVVANPEYDQELREQAKELAMEFFWNLDQPFGEQSDLTSFIDELLTRKKKLVFSIKEIEVKESISDTYMSGAAHLTGKLSATIGEEAETRRDTKIKDIYFLLTQVKKDFGDEKLIVWEIKLGKKP